MSPRRDDKNMQSTTAVAKHFDIPAKRIFLLLQEKSWIQRVDEHWRLTGKGEFEGGEYIRSKKYGEYIGWPADILEHPIFQQLLDMPLNVATLGGQHGIAPHRFNALLAELGWQKRFHKGWSITSDGERHGGSEREDSDSGVPYTVWPRDIAKTPALATLLQQLAAVEPALESDGDTVDDTTGDSTNNTGDSTQQSLALNSPNNSPALTYCARDGHSPQSSEHHRVCNWLYLMNVVHAYRRPLDDSALGCCDFYLPAAHLHLECWQERADAKTMSGRLARIEYYQQRGLAYIDLTAEQLEQLDRILPKILLKHGITVY